MVTFTCDTGVLIRHVEEAKTLFQRMRGLLGCRGLGPERALLIASCRAVHTVGMRFALDLVFLDRANVVVRIVRNVPPRRWCVWGGWRAHRVLECEAGCVDLAALRPGMTLHCAPWAGE